MIPTSAPEIRARLRSADPLVRAAIIRYWFARRYRPRLPISRWLR